MIKTTTQVRPTQGTDPHEGSVVESEHGSAPTTEELQSVVADFKQRLHKLEAEGLNKPLQSELRSRIQVFEGVIEAVLNDSEINEISSESDLV